jgi:hypothetical protein
MSNEVLVDDIVRDFDNDVVGLTTIEDESICAGKDKKGHKRKRTSVVWQHFDAIRGTEGEKLKEKCKLCGTIYLAPITFGTRNLKRHLDTCPS